MAAATSENVVAVLFLPPSTTHFLCRLRFPLDYLVTYSALTVSSPVSAVQGDGMLGVDIQYEVQTWPPPRARHAQKAAEKAAATAVAPSTNTAATTSTISVLNHDSDRVFSGIAKKDWDLPHDSTSS